MIEVDPNPSFKKAVSGATQLEFQCGGPLDGEKRRLILTDRAEIDGFLASIEIESFPDGSWIHCYCDGDPHVIVQTEPDTSTEFTIHHTSSIRWDAYETDLELTEGSKARLEEFLMRHGIRSE